MGEHVLPSKLISSFVCGVNKLHIPIIRVCLPQERVRRAENGRACAFWKTNFQRRVQ